MSSSFVAFEDHGFEADDVTLEVWMAVMTDEISLLEDAPGWLIGVRDDWEWRCTAHLGSGVDLRLDDHARDEEQRRLLIEVAKKSLGTIGGWGDPVPRDTLNGLRPWGRGYAFVDDVPAEVFLRPGRYFIKLLEGSLGLEQTDARLARA